MEVSPHRSFYFLLSLSLSLSFFFSFLLVRVSFHFFLCRSIPSSPFLFILLSFHFFFLLYFSCFFVYFTTLSYICLIHPSFPSFCLFLIPFFIRNISFLFLFVCLCAFSSNVVFLCLYL
jgi:hypothetical protein